MLGRYMFVCLSTVWVLTACDTGTNSSNTIPVDTICAKAVDPYFYCQVGDREFYLCQANANRLEFQVIQNKKIQQSYRGELAKDFHYENYHRFKVTENSVSFQGTAASYEIYDYYDEESKPAMYQNGVVITQDNAIENIVCNKSKSRLAAIKSVSL